MSLARRLLLILRVPLIIEVFVTCLVLLLRLKQQTKLLLQTSLVGAWVIIGVSPALDFLYLWLGLL